MWTVLYLTIVVSGWLVWWEAGFAGAVLPLPPCCGTCQRHPGWACYHTDLDVFRYDGREYGIVGHAVGAAFAVLIAEELFAAGCRFLVSVTSAGQILPVQTPRYFVVIERALRDEGTLAKGMRADQSLRTPPLG